MRRMYPIFLSMLLFAFRMHFTRWGASFYLPRRTSILRFNNAESCDGNVVLIRNIDMGSS